MDVVIHIVVPSLKQCCDFIFENKRKYLFPFPQIQLFITMENTPREEKILIIFIKGTVGNKKE